MEKIEVKNEFIDENLSSLTEKLIQFNSNVWKLKKEKNLSLKDSIKVKIPAELEIFKEDLISCHNIQE